jgi:ProP effector
MNTKSKSIPVSDAQALLSTLKETFPVFLNNEPLAIGIDKQILARLPETPRKVLRMVLAYHTKSTRYLQKTIKATTRFDLDGNPAEPETHKTHAEEMLKERAKNKLNAKGSKNVTASSCRGSRKTAKSQNKPACAEIRK